MTRDDVIRSTAQHIRIVGMYLADAANNLVQRAVVHDESKWEPQEWPAFEAATPKLADLTYGSPEYKAALESIQPALRHHYGCNRHHPEFYPGGIHEMTALDLIEMLCDWKAASERHKDGSLARSIEQNAARFGYDDRFKRFLANTASELGLLTDDEWYKVVNPWPTSNACAPG